MADRVLRVPWGASDVGGGLGANIRHDERSKNFLAKTEPAKKWKTVNHRHYGPPLDQQHVGACVGFTGADYLNSHPAHKAHAKLYNNQDGFQFYSATTQIDQWPGDWFYTPPGPGYGDDTGTDALALCQMLQRRALISKYEWAFGLEQGLGALQLAPVMCGTNWYEGMDHPDTNGLVKPTGNIRGRHEYSLIGYNTKTRLIKCLNHWGAWGFKNLNVFFLQDDDLGALLEAQGDLVVATV